jgi:hypothetical protein
LPLLPNLEQNEDCRDRPFPVGELIVSEIFHYWAACREVVFQLLDPVLAISPPALDPPDLQSRKIQIGDHRRIVPLPDGLILGEQRQRLAFGMSALFDALAHGNAAPGGLRARCLIHHLREFKPVVERPPAERGWRALLGLQRLIAGFNFTHEQAAEAVGKSRSVVSNLLRLLELAAPVQDRVMAGTLEMGHARALAPLAKDKQVMLAEKIAINGLFVRATEALVKDEIGADSKKRPGVPTARSKQEKLALNTPRDLDPDRLETELAASLGTHVKITYQANGQGELVIRYASLDQLDGLIARLKR